MTGPATKADSRYFLPALTILWQLKKRKKEGGGGQGTQKGTSFHLNSKRTFLEHVSIFQLNLSVLSKVTSTGKTTTQPVGTAKPSSL